MRDFGLESYFEKWEFKAQYHMTASDAESLTLTDLLVLASPEDREAFESQWLGYSDTKGALDLRETIGGLYGNLHPDHVLCFAGAQEGIYAAMRSFLTRDDHMIVIVPNYQAAETIPLDICDVTGVPLQPDNNWQIDLDEVASQIKPNTKLVSINFPNNPTGATLKWYIYEGLIDLCRHHGIWLFSDEVYRGLEQGDGKLMPQAVNAYEKGMSLNVMSKAYGLPGLRIGWIACQDTDMLARFNDYKHYLSICNPGPSEHLAKIALKARDTILKRNRAIVGECLSALDGFFADFSGLFEWAHPDGGCVAFPRYLGRDGVEAMCANVLKEEGVLLLPASLYTSEILPIPTDRFRVGCGRRGIEEGLTAFRRYLERNHNSIAP